MYFNVLKLAQPQTWFSFLLFTVFVSYHTPVGRGEILLEGFSVNLGGAYSC